LLYILGYCQLAVRNEGSDNRNITIKTTTTATTMPIIAPVFMLKNVNRRPSMRLVGENLEVVVNRRLYGFIGMG
jgi:hypothetical protein